MMFIYLITPLLGSLKNYVKYKKFNIFNFIRTPFIYFLLMLTDDTINKWKILIYERWFFFIFKIIRSLWRNDYIKNKNKYKIKYNIKYH